MKKTILAIAVALGVLVTGYFVGSATGPGGAPPEGADQPAAAGGLPPIAGADQPGAAAGTGVAASPGAMADTGTGAGAGTPTGASTPAAAGAPAAGRGTGDAPAGAGRGTSSSSAAGASGAAAAPTPPQQVAPQFMYESPWEHGGKEVSFAPKGQATVDGHPGTWVREGNEVSVFVSAGPGNPEGDGGPQAVFEIKDEALEAK